MRPAWRSDLSDRPAGISGMRGFGFVAGRMGGVGALGRVVGCVPWRPCPIHPSMAAPGTAGKIAAVVAARLARRPVQAAESPTAIMSAHELPCGRPEPGPCDWVWVERATGPLRRATRLPLLVRQAGLVWFDRSPCRSSAAGCRRERPSWPFHPDSVATFRLRCASCRSLHFSDSRRRCASRFNAGIKPSCHL